MALQTPAATPGEERYWDLHNTVSPAYQLNHQVKMDSQLSKNDTEEINCNNYE